MENILLDQILQQVQNKEISIEKARELICVLFDVVGQSEQLVCDKCNEDGWITENKGDILEHKLCNCSKAN